MRDWHFEDLERRVHLTCRSREPHEYQAAFIVAKTMLHEGQGTDQVRSALLQQRRTADSDHDGPKPLEVEVVCAVERRLARIRDRAIADALERKKPQFPR
ncbi:MAG TPA: hypothetical protein VGY55_07615 [Pirellulales bacterium]|jgi:hypothetical protein|nr:hypothetical protein [Pirellulales bacterium]